MIELSFAFNIMLSLMVLKFYCALSKSVITCNEYCLSGGIGDNFCDDICMIKECNYDSPLFVDDRYLSFKSSDCFSSCGCNEVQLTNGICDSECNKLECGFDLGDCGFCAPGCFLEDLESDICIDECFVALCKYYDINECYFGLCAPKCFLNYLGDGYCHWMCLNPECSYDLGDCGCSRGCFVTKGDCLTNESYTDPCDNPLCDYKHGNVGIASLGALNRI